MSARPLLTLLFALTLTACGTTAPEQTSPKQLTVVAEKRQGRLVKLTVDSPALGRKALLEVVLPTGWQPGTEWPVLYLLEGCCHADALDWVSQGRADEVTKDADVIVVVPEGGYAGFYSDWREGPKWETFHLKEVLELVESKYGATDRRAIAGLSMGGFGALSYAARHPGMFRAAASFSGLVDVTEDNVDYITGKSGENAADLWGANKEDLPAHNPTVLAEKLKDIPVYVATGDGRPGPLDGPGASHDYGEAGIETQNRTFAKTARVAGVKVTESFYGPGRHVWPYWTRELERALPLLLS